MFHQESPAGWSAFYYFQRSLKATRKHYDVIILLHFKHHHIDRWCPVISMRAVCWTCSCITRRPAGTSLCLELINTSSTFNPQNQTHHHRVVRGVPSDSLGSSRGEEGPAGYLWGPALHRGVGGNRGQSGSPAPSDPLRHRPRLLQCHLISCVHISDQGVTEVTTVYPLGIRCVSRFNKDEKALVTWKYLR